jgi:hypothetical protein
MCLFTDKLPTYSHCTYEDDLCGWHEKEMTWIRQNGSHANSPSEDHTYKNASGEFLYHHIDYTFWFLQTDSFCEADDTLLHFISTCVSLLYCSVFQQQQMFMF